MATLLMILLMLVGLFLILLILVQKGRGGGLAGAFGGAGGQSAFGTKAGDVFTKITVITASIWIGLAALTVVVMAKQNADPAGQFKKAAAEASLETTAEGGSGEAEEVPGDDAAVEDAGSSEQ